MIIFHQLSRLSISDDHIRLKQSQKNAGKIKWDFSSIAITLSPDINFSQVKNSFKRGFSFFDLENLKDLKYRFSNSEDNCLKIDVRIQGFETHELSFCYPSSVTKHQTSPEDGYRVAIVIDDLGENYKTFKKLLDLDIPAEDSRYVLPNAACTNILVTMNARSLLNFFELRCCQHAQWEIRQLANKMLQEVKKVAPTIFNKAGPACKSKGICPENKKDCPLYPK